MADSYESRLKAIRDRLTDEMAVAEGSNLAAVAKQLADVLGRLELLPAGEASAVDELKKKRARRRAAVVADGAVEQRGVGGS